MAAAEKKMGHGNAGNGDKEESLKQLASKLEQAGFRVRREKLKQGFGWKVVSGTCRAGEQRFVFVDRKSPLDDQILFLKSLVQKLAAGSPAS